MYFKLNNAYGCSNCREIREGFEEESVDIQPNTWSNASIEHKKEYSNKIAFKALNDPFDETMSGFGGTQLCVLNIAKKLTDKYEVYIVHDKRKKDFVGESGIKYVRNINEELFRVIIDVRFVREKFLRNVKYIHWIHDCHQHHRDKSNQQLKMYDHVISLIDIQKSLWDKSLGASNFEVINNPFILESVERKRKVNKHKIVAFSSKTNWEKCLHIVKKLRSVDKRFTLHICSPSYSNISNKLKSYDFVVNHGSLSHHDMMELLSDAFVCLYPTGFQESYGCICDECMYYGIPMLTEYVEGSGVNDIIPKNLILPSGCDISIYVNIILDWYKNGTRPKLNWNERNNEIYKQWEQLIEK